MTTDKKKSHFTNYLLNTRKTWNTNKN